MPRRMAQFVLLLLVCLLPATGWAERVADLPMPTRYVNDFAGVLSPGIAEELEQTCRELHDQAHADVAVVTIKTLDDGETVDDFTSKLEEKWKLGKGGHTEGSDRSAIYLLVLNPHKLRVEPGYGLEGILPDAKVGRILDTATPDAAAGDYDGAMSKGLNGLAQVIAQDAGVTLTPPQPRYRQPVQTQAPQSGLGAGQIFLGVFFLFLFVVLVRTGNLGWALVLLSNILGGGGGGGGRGGDDDSGFGGGGFGGSGGGSSGGGGASRDF